jgi:hypothetical protein
VAAAAGLSVGASPAGARPGQEEGDGDEQSGITVEVEAGIGGWVVPGEAYPVHVTVAADRLIDGVLRMHVPSPSGETLVERDVEISGGSTARIDLVAPAWPGPVSESRVELRVEGEVVARAGFEPTESSGDELVGLLPEVVAGEGGADALPSTVPVVADLGDVRPVPVDTNVLALGALALGPLDQLVANGEELAALPDGQQAAVSEWVQSGGQLLLMGDAEALEAATGAVPLDWLPVEGGDVVAGLGRVRSVGDDWTEGLLPSPSRANDEAQASNVFAPFSSFDTLAGELGEGAGLRLPGARGMGLLLAGYVLVCGPVVYLVMRRLDRRSLAWVAIPVLAVGSTGITFQTGSSLRKGAGSAQVTVYESGPAGTTATTWSLLANPRGGDVGVELPAGWLASGSTASTEVALAGIGVPRGDVDLDGRSTVRLDTGNGTEGFEALTESDVAGYSLIESRGPVGDMADPLVVEATVDADGVVSGTVRNELDVALDDVVVFVGAGAYAKVGDLGAGDSEDFTVEGSTALAPGTWPDIEAWPGSSGTRLPGDVIVRGGNVAVEMDGGRGEVGSISAETNPDGTVTITDDGRSTVVQVPAEPADPLAEVEAEAQLEAEARRAEAGASAAGGGGQPLPPEIVEPPVPGGPIPIPLPVPAEPDAAPRGDQSEAADDAVILSAWAATQQRVGSNYRPVGQAVAVGWTTDLDAPAQPSAGAGPTKSSYSAVVARSTIVPDSIELAGAASVRSLVRSTPGEVDGEHDSGVWAFQLPTTTADSEAVEAAGRDLVLEVGTGIDRLEVWTPDGWEVVHNAPRFSDVIIGGKIIDQDGAPQIVFEERTGRVLDPAPDEVDPASAAAGTAAAPPTTEPDAVAVDATGRILDPSDVPTQVDVPPDAVIDGLVLVRWSLALDLAGGGTGEVTIHDKEASR